jgi:hypothetical protein
MDKVRNSRQGGKKSILRVGKYRPPKAALKINKRNFVK